MTNSAQPRRAQLLLSVLVCTTAMAATAVAVSPTAAGAAASACGGLAVDSTFAAERERLGDAHACDHLRARQSGQDAHASLADGLHTAVRERVAIAGAVARLGRFAPGRIGRWSKATNPGTETVGIAAVLLHTGKVLLFGEESPEGDTPAYLYDPATGTGHEVPAPAPIFCGSITPLADGRILSVGGYNPVPVGLEDVWMFDPITEEWTQQPDTPLGRYYPTSTRLPDGRVLITAGKQSDGRTQNPTVEVYTPPSAPGALGTLSVVGGEHQTGFYPHQMVMPDGNVLQVDRKRSFRLNTSTWGWRELRRLPINTGVGAAHLMLPEGARGSTKLMMIGGKVGPDATAATQVFDYAKPGAGWSRGPDMSNRRSHMNVVQVPDGSAFAIGGNTTRNFDDPTRRTLFYDPAEGRWTKMAAQTPRRAYHSTAVLLPDGRIMSAGDNGVGGGLQQIDFYRPPYLFRGKRPVITGAPRRVAYGQRFRIQGTGSVARRAVLMAPAATTHANEMNATRVPLTVRRTATGLVATAPRTANVATPGYYMLFTLNAKGVPSVARWVHVG